MTVATPSTRLPRILIINPNMTESVTERIVAMAREEAGDGVEISGATASFGASYIASRVSAAIGGYAALDVAARAMLGATPPDVIVIGCFGDPGIGAIREMTGIPVIGFAEAGLLDAAAEPGRFAVVTNGEAWRDMLEELVGQLGLRDRVAAIAMLGAAAVSATATAAFIEELAETTGAARTVLGGAGLIPLIAEVATLTKATVLDPHRRAIRRAVEVAKLWNGAAIATPSGLTYAGLTPALVEMLRKEDRTSTP